jgi:hypothetical protein
MNRNWLLFEKLFAIIEISLAIVLASVMYRFVSYYHKKFHSNFVAAHVSEFKALILNHHQGYVQIILFTTAGTLLLFSKKTGWMLSVALGFCAVIDIVVFSFFNYRFHGMQLIEAGLVFLSAIWLMVNIVQKHFLLKYKVTKKDWLITVILFILISLDTNWKYLF